MTTLASSLLDFILSLFRDPELAAEFDADPQAVLAEHGLGDVDPADCRALMPMVADFSPVAFEGRPSGHEEEEHEDDEPGGRPHHDRNGEDTTVIHNIKNVENNTTEIDVDIDASHGVWAGGDAYQIWGDDNVIATGGSIAAGEEVEDASIDNSTDVDVEIEDSFNDESTKVDGDGNITGNGNAVGENEVDKSVDVDVDLEDVAIGENAAVVEDSENVAVGEDNVVGDTELEVGDITTVDVDLEDSLNGNTLAGRDVNNTELEVEDSFNDNNLADRGGEITEDSLVVDDSLNNNDVAVAGDDVEDVDQSSDFLSDIELEAEITPVVVEPDA